MEVNSLIPVKQVNLFLDTPSLRHHGGPRVVGWPVSATTKPGLPPLQSCFSLQRFQRIKLYTLRSDSPLTGQPDRFNQPFEECCQQLRFKTVASSYVSRQSNRPRGQVHGASKQHNSSARHRRLDGLLTRLLCVVPRCSSPQIYYYDPVNHSNILLSISLVLIPPPTCRSIKRGQVPFPQFVGSAPLCNSLRVVGVVYCSIPPLPSCMWCSPLLRWEFYLAAKSLFRLGWLHGVTVVVKSSPAFHAAVA
jgi:hypothetical protein